MILLACGLKSKMQKTRDSAVNEIATLVKTQLKGASLGLTVNPNLRADVNFLVLLVIA